MRVVEMWELLNFYVVIEFEGLPFLYCIALVSIL